jgi:hypothetical protein
MLPPMAFFVPMPVITMRFFSFTQILQPLLRRRSFPGKIIIRFIEKSQDYFSEGCRARRLP